MTGRLVVLNTVWVSALIAAVVLGYAQFVVAGDKSHISVVIAVVLATSLLAVAFGRTAHIPKAAHLCETLGFVGTLIGITIGLADVDIGALASPEGIIAAGNSLFAGVATAFCSTITGAFAMLWLWSVGCVVGDSHA